jgi:hypothetical protein
LIYQYVADEISNQLPSDFQLDWTKLANSATSGMSVAAMNSVGKRLGVKLEKLSFFREKKCLCGAEGGTDQKRKLLLKLTDDGKRFASHACMR